MTVNLPLRCILQSSSLHLGQTRSRGSGDLIVLVDCTPRDTYCAYGFISGPEGTTTGEGYQWLSMARFEPGEGLPRLGHTGKVARVHLHRAGCVCLGNGDLYTGQQCAVLP